MLPPEPYGTVMFDSLSDERPDRTRDTVNYHTCTVEGIFLSGALVPEINPSGFNPGLYRPNPADPTQFEQLTPGLPEAER
jgi:hypothetical protein